MKGTVSGIPGWAWLALILAAAAALRLLQLDRGLSLLEMNTWWYGRMPLDFIASRSDYFPHIYALVHLLNPSAGSGEAWLRLPFAAFGLLCLPWIYWLGRRLFDEESGLAASLLAAVSVSHIRLSQEARYYPLLMFYSLAGLCFLLAALEPGGRRRAAAWAGFAAAQGLNFQVHIFAIYPFVLSVMLWAARVAGSLIREDRDEARTTLLAGGTAMLAAALMLAGVHERVWFFFHTQLDSSRTMLETTALRVHNRGDIFKQFLSFFGGSPALGVFLLAAGAAGAALRKGEGRQAYAPLALWVAAPLLSLPIIRSHYHFEPWYFAFCLPVVLVAAAGGLGPLASLAGARGTLSRAATFAALLGCALWMTVEPLQAHYSSPPDPWREAIRRINGSCRPGDAVFFHPPWGRDGATRYYALKAGCREYDISYLTLDAGAAAAEVFRRHERVWLAYARTPFPAEQEEAAGIRALMGRLFLLGARAAREDLELCLYRRNGTALPAPRLPAPPPPSQRAPLPFYFLGNLRGPSGTAGLWMRRQLREPASRIALRRVPAGEWDERDPAAAWPLKTLGVVLRGAVRFQGSRRGIAGASFFREGDVFLTGRDKRPLDPYRSVGEEDLYLLLFGLAPSRRPAP